MSGEAKESGSEKTLRLWLSIAGGLILLVLGWWREGLWEEQKAREELERRVSAIETAQKVATETLPYRLREVGVQVSQDVTTAARRVEDALNKASAKLSTGGRAP